MKLTIEELRKVYQKAAWNEASSSYCTNTDEQDAGILAVARYVAERQRAVEPTKEMIAAMPAPQGLPLWPMICADVYRAMQSVAPLVVPE